MGARLADAPAHEQAIEFLKKNVGEKELVEANFRSFQMFAELQKKQQARLVVLEGQVHPAARTAYDTDDLQQATRERLKAMAAETEFTYIANEQMPEFGSDDFADAYHLNATGRKKLSTFLSTVLNR